MFLAILILHLLVCLGLVGVVLIQSGKGGGLTGGAFGGSAQTVLGGRGATDFVTRATMVLGATFFVTSLVLALMSSGVGRSGRSLIQGQARQAAGQAGQVPQAPAPGSPAGGGAPATGTAPSTGAPAPSTGGGTATPEGGGQ